MKGSAARAPGARRLELGREAEQRRLVAEAGLRAGRRSAGRPRSTYSGTLIAGWPLTLASGVNGMNANTRRTDASTTPGRRSRKPRRSATSTSWANASAPRGASAPMRDAAAVPSVGDSTQVEPLEERAPPSRATALPAGRAPAPRARAVCWRPIMAVIAVLVSSSPRPARAGPARSSPRARSAAISTHASTKKSRANASPSMSRSASSTSWPSSASRRAASSAAAAQSGWGATVVTIRALGQRDAQPSGRRADLGERTGAPAGGAQ